MYEAPKWLQIANKFMGLSEIAGPRHNAQIVEFWRAIGMAGIKDDETPWCGAMTAYCLKMAGIKAPNSGRALDFLHWGLPVEPTVGAVAVFSRNGGGHVGFVVGKDRKGNILILGGNQGNAVNVKAFPRIGGRLRVEGFRWPRGVPKPVYWLPVLDGIESVSSVV